MREPINLGENVRDVISGATGIAVGRATYLTGAIRILVQPRMNHDGIPRNDFWIDENRLEKFIDSRKDHMLGFGIIANTEDSEACKDE